MVELRENRFFFPSERPPDPYEISDKTRLFFGHIPHTFFWNLVTLSPETVQNISCRPGKLRKLGATPGWWLIFPVTKLPIWFYRRFVNPAFSCDQRGEDERNWLKMLALFLWINVITFSAFSLQEYISKGNQLILVVHTNSWARFEISACQILTKACCLTLYFEDTEPIKQALDTID